MINFILAGQNLPFAVAITLMLLIALIEGVTTVFGMGLSSILDSLMPELDIDVDIDGADVQPSSPLTKLLSWLRIGQVPVLVLLVIFLTAFGLLGFGIQSVATRLYGSFLPALPAMAGAIALALPFVRLLGGMLARIMPKDETEAVTEKSFIGLVAVITTGTSKPGSPAQGRLSDRYGQSHYVMIEPDTATEAFPQGTEVLLVSQQGATFRAIRNTSEALRKGNPHVAQ
jgi:hypothetical protein